MTRKIYRTHYNNMKLEVLYMTVSNILDIVGGNEMGR